MLDIGLRIFVHPVGQGIVLVDQAITPALDRVQPRCIGRAPGGMGLDRFLERGRVDATQQFADVLHLALLRPMRRHPRIGLDCLTQIFGHVDRRALGCRQFADRNAELLQRVGSPFQLALARLQSLGTAAVAVILMAAASLPTASFSHQRASGHGRFTHSKKPVGIVSLTRLTVIARSARLPGTQMASMTEALADKTMIGRPKYISGI